MFLYVFRSEMLSKTFEMLLCPYSDPSLTHLQGEGLIAFQQSRSTP